MKSSVDHFRQSIAPIGDKVHPNMLSDVMVCVHQSTMPLISLAHLSLLSSNCIAISPWDAKTIPMIEKALWSCGLDGTPSVLGQSIKFSVPPMSQERRQMLVKRVCDMGELAKVSIRAHRQDIMKLLLHDTSMSEDKRHHAKKVIQQTTDRFVDQIDNMVKQKKQQLMAE